MENTIKKLAKLSSLNFSEKELASFVGDFSDIVVLIDKISDFPVFEDTSMNHKNWKSLRDDTPKEAKYELKTNTVPRII